jgi:hypothetical protein
MPLNTIPNKGLTSRGYPSDRLVTPIIINGDMQVAQRGTSVSSITTSGYFACDRWNFANGAGATFTISQDSSVPTGQGFLKSFKMESTTGEGSMGAAEYHILTQKIEAQNLNSLKWGTSSAESITLSFWVKATVTGTYIVEFYNNDNSGDQLSSSYTINSANTWEKKTITAVGYTSGAFGNDNNTGMQINWWLGAGSNFQSGSLTGTWRTYAEGNRAVGQVNTFENNNNTFFITGVQLEVGEFDSTTIPSFPFESYENNLRKCMRYYQKFGSTAATSCNMVNGMGYSANSSEVFVPNVLPVAMRTGPSVSQNGTIAYRTPGGTKNLTLNSTAVSEKEVFMNFSGSSLTSGDPGYIRNPDGSSGNNIEMSAEL